MKVTDSEAIQRALWDLEDAAMAYNRLGSDALLDLRAARVAVYKAIREWADGAWTDYSER